MDKRTRTSGTAARSGIGGGGHGGGGGGVVQDDGKAQQSRARHGSNIAYTCWASQARHAKARQGTQQALALAPLALPYAMRLHESSARRGLLLGACKQAGGGLV